MNSKQQGFTLIELIVVIVILGILAATALPRFVNIGSDARVAAVNGIAGGLRGAVAAVQGKWYAAGSTAATTVTTSDGSIVSVTATGVPDSSAAGIGLAVGCPSGSSLSCNGMTTSFTSGTGIATFQPAGGNASCQASYDASTGQVTASVTCP